MIIFQPQINTLGKELGDILSTDSDFDWLVFLVAYAKKSGIKKLEGQLTAFSERGGKIKTIN